MPPLRLLIALGAAAGLLAPPVVAAGVAAHLAWAEHHGGHHHDHRPHHPGHSGHAGEPVHASPAVEIATPGGHSHDVPDPEPGLWATLGRQAGPDRALPRSAGALVAPSAPFREGPGVRGRPPDTPPSPPRSEDRIHLHGALLL